jgi:methoxymalonate biosynthesis protein
VARLTEVTADVTAQMVKCLVWDLDQTLWQGVLLEDGQVTLPDDIRSVIMELDRRGILQSVASRNDHDHAWPWLEKFGIAEYFVLPQIGWQAKSTSVRLIAERLGFAEAAMAFIDDQPNELAEVAYHLPGVRCYPAEDAPALPARPEFTPATVTEDSRRRRAMYQAGFRRAAERAAYTGPDEGFLCTLDLRLEIRRAGRQDLARVEELTSRTSQMNATGVHYGAAELERLLDSPDHEVLVATLDDRFGPHGAIGIVLLSIRPALWHLRLLATSCRVVSLGAGSVLIRWLTHQAALAGVHLAADFRHTGRNRMMEVAYRFAGFAEDPCPCLAGLPAEDGVQRLHLAAAPQGPPATMRVRAPIPGDRDRAPAEWVR